MPKADRSSLNSIAPRLLKLCAPHLSTLSIGFVALASGSAINLLFPYLLKNILNQKWGLRLEHDLVKISLGVILLFAIQAVFFYIRHYTFYIVGYRIVNDLRASLYQAIIKQDIAFFDRSRVGDLLSRLSVDTQTIQRALTVNISVSIRYLIQVLGGILLMFFLSPRLTSFMLLLIPLIVICSINWGKKLKNLSRKMQDAIAESTVIAEESVGAVRTVKSFSAESYEIKRFDESLINTLAIAAKRTAVASAFSSSMVFILNTALVFVLAYGGMRVINGEMNIGELSAFLLYGAIVGVSFGFLVNVWDEFLQAIGAGERIYEILDLKAEISSPSVPANIEAAGPGYVNLKNVSFSYPSRPSVTVLRNISFEIASGKTVAVVGPSGAGKSTLAALIQRFYEPTSGQITYKDKPLADIPLEILRSQIAIVPQQPQIFSVSLFENIRYGKITAGKEEVELAAKKANLAQFIDGLPKKYETLVGDRGIQLSGGERQRIAIARAILSNPNFLILDEATSSLDSENERLIQLALQELMRNRTSLIIAHRLSTVQHADLVIVLREGEIIQTGAHQELMSVDGLYKTFVQHQILK